MNRRRTGIIIIITAVCCACLLAVGWRLVFLNRGRNEIETIQETSREPETIRIETTPAEETETEEEVYVSPIDFESLWAVNEDVVGWITVPGTRIDYPILHAEDNEAYLHHNLEGEETVAGSIFLDCDDAADFSSLHNVIYGHHMKDGSMFKDVVYFKEQEYFDQHREVIIYTPEREIHLKTLAALYVKAEPIRRKTSFKSREGFEAYVEQMIQGAGAYASPEGEIGRLYSLITCSYEFSDARTILYAYETEEGEGFQE